jgi:hypothetical protein
MNHYDPDDPIWTEDEDRAAARAESVEDWQREEDNLAHVTVIGLLKDEGTVVQFKTAEGPVLCVPHGLAEVLLATLNADGDVPVVVEAWSLL